VRIAAAEKVLRWSAAVLLPLLAMLASDAFQLAMGNVAPFLPFFPVLLIVALWGGRAPGLLGLVISAAAITSYWVTNPQADWVLQRREHLVALAGFLVAGALLVELAHRARTAQQRADLLAESRRTDLENRHAAESARVESETRLGLALQAAEMGTWEYDSATERTIASRRTLQIFGLEAGENSLDGLFRNVYPDDRAAVDTAVQTALKGGAAFDTEFRIQALGQLRWVRAKALRIESAGGPRKLVGVAEDITERQSSLEEIERGREELQIMLDLLPVGVAIAHDPSAENITMNPSLRKALRLDRIHNASYSGPERDKLPYRCFRNGVEVGGSELPMQIAARTGTDVRDMEVDVVFQDGEVRSFLISAAPLFDFSGRVRGAVGTHVDVTALKDAQQSLEAIDRQKDEFLATLAHELRNPMAPIRYAVAMLRSDAPKAVIDQVRETIDRQSAHMARLLDDLLDMSRLTRNVIQLQRGTLDLREVVHEAIEDCRPAIEGANLQLQVVMPTEPAWVDGDRARLFQVVSNLLSNAAKYTDAPGSVTVELESIDGTARIKVRDTGIGFDPVMAPKLFRLFSQLHPELQAAKGGLGIGLAVVKRLVELHDGEIHATSAGIGRGAEFVVELPTTMQPSSVVRRSAAAPMLGEEHRVLVVDDNVDAAEALAMFLKLHGCVVEVAHEGEGALKIAAEFHPTVVLLDLGLPGMHGRDVGRALRQQMTERQLRLIALTGWGRPEDRRGTIAAGFDAHLVKPVDPEELLSLLVEHPTTGAATASAGSP
jgi:PAS domain S-box-containing protein